MSRMTIKQFVLGRNYYREKQGNLEKQISSKRPYIRSGERSSHCSGKNILAWVSVNSRLRPQIWRRASVTMKYSYGSRDWSLYAAFSMGVSSWVWHSLLCWLTPVRRVRVPVWLSFFLRLPPCIHSLVALTASVASESHLTPVAGTFLHIIAP